MLTNDERQLKKGVLGMLVLRLLSQEETYGYQLLQALREKGGDLFALKEGTLYPVLYRLEEEGLVANRWSSPKDREQPRKYYHITEQGARELQRLTVLWSTFSKSVTEILREG